MYLKYMCIVTNLSIHPDGDVRVSHVNTCQTPGAPATLYYILGAESAW